ncbi:uncharacterized protein LOC126818412 isoform X2 [Patella vulgata]|uniref:uncharacterized protein LOC126818412 isoform X2 n=1 Tax=Patella vulgata TaxID=6465 RepID=UPI00217F751F|nr:uncharacterized protein LOC126818412 isoform X2 [Patella vulgata]
MLFSIILVLQIFAIVSNQDINEDERTILQAAYKNTLENLEQAEHYIKETKKSLESLSELLKGDTATSKEDVNKVEDDKIDMTDVYKILDSKNVRERIDQQKRPEHATGTGTDFLSKVLGSTYKRLQEKSEIGVSGFKIRFVNDENRDYFIACIEFDVDDIYQDLVIKSYIRIQNEFVIIFPEWCGSGVCLLQQREWRRHKLILVLRKSMVSTDPGSILMMTYVTMSKADDLFFHLIIPQDKNLSSYKNAKQELVPSYDIQYANQSTIVYNPSDYLDDIHLFTKIESVTANLTSVYSSTNFYTNESVSISNETDENSITSSSAMAIIDNSFDLSDPLTNNGIYSNTIRFRSRDDAFIDWSLYINRVYRVFPENQSKPKALSKTAMKCYNTAQPISVKLGAAISVECRVIGMTSPEIKVYQLRSPNGPRSNDFSGFYILKYTNEFASSIIMTTYSVQLEDEGEYYITAGSNDMYLSESFRLNVTEEED